MGGSSFPALKPLIKLWLDRAISRICWLRGSEKPWLLRASGKFRSLSRERRFGDSNRPHVALWVRPVRAGVVGDYILERPTRTDLFLEPPTSSARRTHGARAFN